MPLIPINTLSTSTNQPIINTTKSSSAKGNNRKQQQMQQQKTAQTNPPNGRKNGKINGKNETRKNWKQRLTTTHRPYTIGKDRKYDNINGMMSFMNKTLTITTTTTMRPINKLPSNNVDAKTADKSMYGKTPIKAPKQIKEIVAGNHSPNATIIPGVGVHDTIVDGIILHHTTASPYDAQVDFIDSFPYTSNPNLPKFFQHYEKIQEFYPEFHPYVVPKAASSGGSAMKPLRDGSKNTHFASTLNQQQFDASLSSSAEDSHSSMDGPASRANGATIIASNAGKG